MISSFFEKKDKKVEYIELIYDLIFVYVIGRNNALLHNFENGFVRGDSFFFYIVCTLAVIQIWNFTTYYINAYGRNGVRDHVFMFINMFLLYFIAEGTRHDWEGYHTMYHVAWTLILLNIAVQYFIELRHHTDDPFHRRRIIRISVILLIEASLVGLSIGEFLLWHSSWISLGAILFGIVCMLLVNNKNCTAAIDFEHLSERAMLYVVFTFGEMIIAIAGYFNGEFSLSSLYYSLMAFLIVVGLLLSYGVLYDKIIDRELKTNGLVYMFLHIFIIFALNNITSALEFMRNEEVALLPKLLFITFSIFLYFAFLLSLSRYAKKRCGFNLRFFLKLIAESVIFAFLMVVFREQMAINIAVTVLYVFGVFFFLWRYGKNIEKHGDNAHTLK